MTPSQPKPRQRLFWRIYLAGIVMVIAAAVAAAVAGHLLHDGAAPGHRATAATARFVDGYLAPLLDQPDALKDRLEFINEVFESDLAVYDPNHQLIAFAGDRALEPAPETPTRPRVFRQRGRLRRLVPIGPAGSYLTTASRHRGQISDLAMVVSLVLLVLAALAIPVTRAITKPLEQLTMAATHLGDGDLSVRSGIQGRGEVGLLAHAFDDMAARLEGSIKNEKELLANVSHELRTPMARIRVALELCSEERGDLQLVRKRLSDIQVDLDELEKLIEDVMMTTRLDRQHEPGLKLRTAPIGASDAIAEAVKRFAELYPNRLVHQDGIAQELVTQSDGALLKRALGNFLENAARYTDNTAAPIEIGAFALGEQVRFEVRDRGSGVDEIDKNRLFQPFYRADRSRSRASGGSGLGLALCRRIAEAHGGAVGVNDRDEGGSVFWLTLPRAQ